MFIEDFQENYNAAPCQKGEHAVSAVVTNINISANNVSGNNGGIQREHFDSSNRSVAAAAAGVSGSGGMSGSAFAAYLLGQHQQHASNLSSVGGTAAAAATAAATEVLECNRASSLLFLLLMFGTVWIGVSLYNFNKTYFLSL